ncbi:MAG: sigma-70 family RNA polymerase sigma factor [Actinomycetota bacterium]|nr:sigma-70 family RNA polymerase sigma factor [Actinomycetota bacterium]
MNFAAAYDEHVWTVYGFIAYRVGSRDDAEDLTQQTFERALRAWGRFDSDKASMATWLLTIARLVIDHYRARREHADLGDAEPRTHASYDLGLSPALAGALASLSPRDREVVALRYGGDLTGPEIAEVTQLSLANVQQILSRSLRRLRERMEGDAEEADAGTRASS